MITLNEFPVPGDCHCLVPRRLSFDENVRAKEGGKETTGETSGRSCFQDGGKSNGGRICSFYNNFSPVHFANFEQIIAYPHRVYEEEAVFTPHVGLKHHNVYYRTTTELHNVSVKSKLPLPPTPGNPPGI